MHTLVSWRAHLDTLERERERVLLMRAFGEGAERMRENAAAGDPPWFGPQERALVERLARG